MGYGKFWIDNRQYRAHRVSWNIHFGDIPKGLLVLHKCDNPSCVNPSHLFLGTNEDNTRDMVLKNRNTGNKRLSETDVLTIRALFHWSKFSTVEIAKEYGMTNPNIHLIVKGKSWKSLRIRF